jgi:hypothetical protein
METSPEGTIIYKATQVEENGLLKMIHTGRMVPFTDKYYTWESSYNQPLYIGTNHPPAEAYVRLHELLARIFQMRGSAKYYDYDSEDDY